MRTRSAVLIAAALLCVGCDKKGPGMHGSVGGSAVDNSSVNQRDRESTAKTPIDQNENKKDIGITADIRRRVVDTKMSIDAQNVKIITQDGRVTLRGPVQTPAEKSQIEAMAREVAGATNVDSQLEVVAR